MKDFLIKNKLVVLLILFVVLNIFISYFYIGYDHRLMADATTYFNASEFLQGKQSAGPEILNRVLTTPLFLYSSIFINYFIGDFSTSFSIINIIFYFLYAIAFYLLAFEIYKEKKMAFLSSILVIFNYYVIDPSNAHLADLGGWFFFILATYLAVKYFNTANKNFYYLSVLVSAVGVLFKEYGGLGLINLILLVLVSDFSLKQKIKDITLAGFMFLAVLVSYHSFIFFHYHYSYFDWYVYVNKVSSVPGYKAKGFVLLVKILGWLFSFGWLAWLYGVWREWKIKDWRRIKILLAILPVTLTFYIWPAITQRLAVMFMMWLALIAGFGLSRVKWYMLYPFLGLYIWFNYNIKILIDKINMPF